MKKLISFILCLSLLPTTALAQSLKSLSMDSFLDDAYKSRLAEYFYNSSRSQVLVPVKLMGQVQRPGLYHLPTDTNLTTLLTIAGGPAKSADTEKIQVSSEGQVREKNLKDLISAGSDYSLKRGDIIVIPEKQPMFSSDTVTAITLVSVVVSTILTAVLVDDALKD